MARTRELYHRLPPPQYPVEEDPHGWLKWYNDRIQETPNPYPYERVNPPEHTTSKRKREILSRWPVGTRGAPPRKLKPETLARMPQEEREKYQQKRARWEQFKREENPIIDKEEALVEYKREEEELNRIPSYNPNLDANRKNIIRQARKAETKISNAAHQYGPNDTTFLGATYNFYSPRLPPLGYRSRSRQSQIVYPPKANDLYENFQEFETGRELGTTALADINPYNKAAVGRYADPLRIKRRLKTK